MSYESKTLISTRGKLITALSIVDSKGERSRVVGTSFDSPNVKKDYERMFESAIYNAIYKHFWKKGKVTPSYEQEYISEDIESLSVINFYFIYYDSFDYYTYHRINIKGKQYIQTRRKGKIHKTERVQIVTKQKSNRLVKSRLVDDKEDLQKLQQERKQKAKKKRERQKKLKSKSS